MPRPCCGESPVWSAEEQALYWADIIGATLHRLDPATGQTRTWRMPESIGSFRPARRRRRGGRPAQRVPPCTISRTERLTFLSDPEAEEPRTRFNDGKVGPRWPLLGGDHGRQSTSGGRSEGLYRLDPDHSWHQDGRRSHQYSNGLAWSADGKTMFHSDSRGAGH